MTNFEEINKAIDGLERATQFLSTNECNSLLYCLNLAFLAKQMSFNEDEVFRIETRLDDCEMLIRVRGEHESE